MNDFQGTARSDEQRGDSLEGYSAVGEFGFKYTHTYIYYFKYQDPKKPTITRKWSCKSLLQFVTL